MSASGRRSVSLAYDAIGRLARVTSGSTATDYLYDGSDLVAEYENGTLARRHVHGPGTDEPLVTYETGTSGTAKVWLYGDAQGSIVAMAGSDGNSLVTNSYGPYGEPGLTAAGRFGYTGQAYIPELGLYYYKARFYSPWHGRFLQSDPIGTEGGMNLYEYAGGDPVNGSDPDGLQSVYGPPSKPKFGNYNSPYYDATDPIIVNGTRYRPLVLKSSPVGGAFSSLGNLGQYTGPRGRSHSHYPRWLPVLAHPRKQGRHGGDFRPNLKTGAAQMEASGFPMEFGAGHVPFMTNATRPLGQQRHNAT